jgi:hypothetical protein
MASLVTKGEREMVLITHPWQAFSKGTFQVPHYICQAKYVLHGPVAPLQRGDKVVLWETGTHEKGIAGKIGETVEHEKSWITVKIDQRPLPSQATYLLKLHASQLQLSMAVYIMRKVWFALSKESGMAPPQTIPSPFRTSGEVCWNRMFME